MTAVAAGLPALIDIEVKHGRRVFVELDNDRNNFASPKVLR